MEQEFEQVREGFAAIRRELTRVIVGQDEVLDGMITALLCGGHLLLDGDPGLGKTLLVRTLADTLSGEFRRIQCTSDMMPADIIGTYVVMESHGRRQFEFQQGPIFTNLLLADEINRATPKTQAALLEGLGECAVTVANVTYDLPDPFFTVATQSESGAEETFPLGPKQLDRFFFKLHTEYPTNEQMAQILERTTEPQMPVAKKAVDAKRLVEMMGVVRQVTIADEVRDWAIQVVQATRPQSSTAGSLVKRYVSQGSSPRGAQAMILAGKVFALLDSRVHVSREDLQKAALPALRHRLSLNFEGHAEQIDPDKILAEILQ
ncbi:AAA family ATPase [Lignipirellula cremea]|uniref:ATPase family associated with various cellular activities (AAA) n=1 Tax=Lignipirellula cremea TaxID=2528010 RepID=A0A518E2R8_9BACT|nr:MoxR family ATPase [Lignipirellula cremea]QDU98388.1 ATPase family associated with various cellular activities (AAA) [Lignipirellula cremea]